jgi:DNA polymerase-3 subunit epsilon
MSAVIKDIVEFFKGAVPMAHHAPFDMGFIALDLETHNLPLPTEPVLCTSLLARKLIHGTENHKLQTLVKHLGIDGGAAHRALDDARSCLKVGLKCLELLGPEATLRRALEVQEKKLLWPNFTLLSSKDPNIQAISQATHQKCRVEFLYDKSSTPRRAVPMGIVRSPDGDFMQAMCLKDQKAKRFYLERIHDAVVIPGADFDPSAG